MAVFQVLLNLDEVFHSLKVKPAIVNDLEATTEQDRERLSNMIFQKFGDGTISCIPKCECGHTQGAHLLGEICEICGFPVTDPFDQKLEPLIWMRAPEGVAPLMNPMVLLQLRQRFSKSGFNLIEWMINRHYRAPGIVPNEVQELLDMGVERGYNKFYQNFDRYIDFLFSLKMAKCKDPREDALYMELRLFRDKVFSRHLAMPNRTLMVIEDNHTGTYIDDSILGALDAINLMTGIDKPIRSASLAHRESTTAKALIKLTDYYDGIHYDVFAKKGGLLRKHIFGGRNMFSARAVISSLTDPHDYDELHISWGVGVTLFHIHLMNRLMRAPYNLTPRQADHKIKTATYNYDEDIDKLFQELIANTPEKGFVCIFQRNPSLERGSAQRLRITKVKTNPRDQTISVSILVVRGYNADFDGDEMNLILALDNVTAESWNELAPHKSIIDINSSRKLSNAAAIPKPVVMTVNNWLHYNDQKPTPEQVEFMRGISINPDTDYYKE